MIDSKKRIRRYRGAGLGAGGAALVRFAVLWVVAASALCGGARPARAIDAPAPGAPPDSTRSAPAPALTIPRESEAGESTRPIRSIRATGFVHVDSMVIIRTFGLRVGDPYGRETVRDGVRRLFQSGLYTDVNVVDAVEGEGVGLTVVVAERPRIKGIKFKGSGKIEESKLKAKLTSSEGQLLDQGVLDLDAGKVAEAYAEEGYALAKVRARTQVSDPGVVDVVFEVEEGSKVKVREVQVHGYRGTLTLHPEDLQGAMKSKTPGFLRGGVYKPSQLDQDATQLRLFMRSRGFKDADVDSIRPVYTPDGKGVALHVYVREGSRYRFGERRRSGNTIVPTTRAR